MLLCSRRLFAKLDQRSNPDADLPWTKVIGRCSQQTQPSTAASVLDPEHRVGDAAGRRRRGADLDVDVRGRHRGRSEELWVGHPDELHERHKAHQIQGNRIQGNNVHHVQLAPPPPPPLLPRAPTRSRTCPVAPQARPMAAYEPCPGGGAPVAGDCSTSQLVMVAPSPMLTAKPMSWAGLGLRATGPVLQRVIEVRREGEWTSTWPASRPRSAQVSSESARVAEVSSESASISSESASVSSVLRVSCSSNPSLSCLFQTEKT